MDKKNIKETLMQYQDTLLQLCNKVHNCNDSLLRLDDKLEYHVNKIILTDYMDELIIKDLVNKKFTCEYMLKLKHVSYNYLDNDNNATQCYHYFKLENDKFIINFKNTNYITLQSLQDDCKLLNIILERIEECIKDLS